MKNNKHYAYESPFKMVDHDGVEYTLTVEQDNCPESPKEWDNLCTMTCWHSRYDLGDKHTFDDPYELMQHLYLDATGKHWIDDHDSECWQDVYKALKETDLILIKQLNVYEHSGMTISTSNGYPYNDRWDSYPVGFVYVTKKTIFLECAGITEENWKERADKYLEGEVETYDQYLRGDVYGFTLTKTVIEQDICPHCGEVIREYEDEVEEDSCWGFYGDCLEDNGILDNLGNLKFVED
jgi:hypothetical protein